MADPPTCCCRQQLADALAELQVLRLIHAMRPYMISALPAPPPPPRIPQPRRPAVDITERRIHELRAAAPPVPAPVEAEPWWPTRKGIRVPPKRGH